MNHCGTVPLETERCRLRSESLEDARAMFEGWTCDPEVARYMSWEPHQNLAETLEMLSVKILPNYVHRHFYEWGIVSKESGRLIGAIGAKVADSSDPVAYVGYCLTHDMWGKGITAEVLAEVIRFLFFEVGFSFVRAKRQTANVNSGRVMGKVGMVRYAEGYEVVKGKNVPFSYHEIRPFVSGKPESSHR